MDTISKLLVGASNVSAIFIIIIFFLVVATAIIVLVLSYQKKQLHYIKEKEQLKLKFEKEILEAQIEIQEQTLQHFSRELHDNLGQIASLIKINLYTIDLSNLEKSHAKIENTKSLILQLIVDIKALSVNLNGDRLFQHGLAEALEFEIEQLNNTEQVTAKLSFEGNIPEFGKDKAIILYRMAQEALNNIVKHSQAKHVRIMLEGTKNLFKMNIIDDGVGFSEQDINKNGAGLRNLKNRARLINARLDIRSIPGSGSDIGIELQL